jgi:hypothetical protein
MATPTCLPLATNDGSTMFATNPMSKIEKHSMMKSKDGLKIKT